MKRIGLGITSAIAGLAMSGLASTMLGFGSVAPAYGAQPTPRFKLDGPEYDGLGRKIKPKWQPRHNAKKRTRSWREYAERVVATHSFNEDPRDGKYLHSHARNMRGLRLALQSRRVVA